MTWQFFSCARAVSSPRVLSSASWAWSVASAIAPGRRPSPSEKQTSYSANISQAVQIWNLSTGHDTSYVTNGDINDDGKLDLIVGGTGSGETLFSIDNDGNLSFSLNVGGTVGYSESYGSGTALDVSDMNDDGINDIAVGSVDNKMYITQSVSCLAQFNDSTSYNMTWNSSLSKWQAPVTFTTSGSYTYNITCDKGGYTSQFLTSTLEVTSEPAINSNYTVATYPKKDDNVTFIVNITDEDSNVESVNFTITDPSGTIVVASLNGSNSGDLWNVTYNLSSYGTWTWNVSVYDTDGHITNSNHNKIILMRITQNLNATTVLVSESVNVYGKINLSNGTNASNTVFNLYVNESLYILNGSISEINSSDWDLGTSVNVTVNINNITLTLNGSNQYPNQTGNFTSQIIDTFTGSNFTFISWEQEVPYQTELGRFAGDVNDATGLGGINTSGLVLLMHFNNESAYGESTEGINNRTVDFSVYVNSERTGAVGNNGTLQGGSTINKTDYKFGSGAAQFDGTDYIAIPSEESIDALTEFTYSAWIYPYTVGNCGSNYGVCGVIISKGGDGG